MSARPAADLLWPKLVETANGCWLFTGRLSESGYGWMSCWTTGTQKTLPVHRVAWEFFFGPIPAGLQLDHLCHNEDPMCHQGKDCLHRRCANPWHLDPVTPAVNARRVSERRTHCTHGHAFDTENTRVRPDGTRLCRRCHRDQEGRRQKARRIARAAA